MENRAVAELVKRVSGGDTRAFEELFLATKDDVFFHAKTALKSEENAWDVVQDTYIAAYRSMDKLKAPETVQLWLCAIAGNLCFTRLRRLSFAANEQREKPAEAAQSEAGRDVLARLERLTETQRIAVLYRYCDDMSLARIGTMLRCGESAVKTLLADAERVMKLERESAGKAENAPHDGGVITPSALKAGLEELRQLTTLPLPVTLGIAEAVARAGGYTSTLRVVTTRQETKKQPEKNSDKKTDDKLPREEKPQRQNTEAPRERTRRAAHGAKKSAMALASGLVVVGVVVGAFAIRAVMDARKGKPVLPDNISALTDENDDHVMLDETVNRQNPTPEKSALSAAAAQAYIGVISDYTGRLGVCAMQDEGQGLAYAELIDFDRDGAEELYLFYIDKSFSGENEPYRLSSSGEERACLHEEVWSYNGELTRIYAQEHCANGSLEDGTGASRWLCELAGGTQLVSWYSYTDENGYINQSLTRYELKDGALSPCEEVTGMFVVANAANQRRDGYLIEQYYGTDNAHFDDVAYFVEGALISADGRQAFNYEQCQGILDIGTADVVPLNNAEGITPVSKLSEGYTARRQGIQLITVTGDGDDAKLSWLTNDVNAFLSELADICIA